MLLLINRFPFQCFGSFALNATKKGHQESKGATIIGGPESAFNREKPFNTGLLYVGQNSVKFFQRCVLDYQSTLAFSTVIYFNRRTQTAR